MITKNIEISLLRERFRALSTFCYSIIWIFAYNINNKYIYIYFTGIEIIVDTILDRSERILLNLQLEERYCRPKIWTL